MTKADKGVAPASSGAAPVVTSISPSGNVGVIAAPEHAIVRGKFTEYLDDTLEAGLRQRVDQHLQACRDCMAFLKTLQATIGVLEQLPSPKAPRASINGILEQARLLDRAGVLERAPGDSGDATSA